MSCWTWTEPSRGPSLGLCLAGAVLIGALGCREDSGSPTEPGSPSPQANLSAAALSYRYISTGVYHTCGVTLDDRAYCWGMNIFGGLGDGTTTDRKAPVRVAGGLRLTQISAGNAHTCGIDRQQQAYCWGLNEFGTLGDGTTTNRRRPVRVLGRLRFRQINAGTTHTCGVTTAWQVYCWGNNGYGELGDGTTTNRLIPQVVAGERRYYQKVTTGEFGHTCALTRAGQAFCWGNNFHGELGDGTTINRDTPTAVATELRFAASQITTGGFYSCAVTTGQRAYCWGSNAMGELGDGTTTDHWEPAPVADASSFRQVRAGGHHNCGVTTSTKVRCWGINHDGQFGDGTRSLQQATPVPAAGSFRFSQVDAGEGHTCGVTADNRAYCWGLNDSGQLGDGTQTNRLTPVAVAGAT